MDKRFFLPLAAVLGGAAAFVLRLLQDQTGFEAESGLPISGNPAGIALLVLLAAMAAVFWLLGRLLPAEDPEAPPEFPAAFHTDSPALLTLAVGGVALMGLGGLVDVAEVLGLLPQNLVNSRHALCAVLQAGGLGFVPLAQLLLGLLLFLSSGGLFLAAAACRGREAPRPLADWVLLPPAAVLVVRLVLTYRMDSVNPSLAMYYPELLALSFLTMGFYRLSSFAFQAGDTRRFSLYACMAVILCCAALADGSVYLSSILVYAGGAVAMLGFLLLRLATLPGPEPEDDGVIVGPAE